MIPQINIEDFTYDLPDERIAKYPLPKRDSSKLLIYKNGKCKDRVFRNITTSLPKDALMIFNDTKVVPARLFFRRESGAHIEVFCLKPVEPSDYALNFASTSSCRWFCVVGNIKRWKEGSLLYDFSSASSELLPRLGEINLKATLVSRDNETAVVEFSWDGGAAFSSVLELCGRVPIPPYLNRDTEQIDLERYQTTYAHIRGSVAAPTAGLHFTDDVLKKIRARGISTENVCLHVGAGTFLPVKTANVADHTMHREPFSVSLALLRRLSAGGRKVIAVGTTSMRTLESLYYVGVSCIEKGRPEEVAQWAPYERSYQYSLQESLEAIINYLIENGLTEIKVETRIIIVPGFKFRIVDMLVTNFHQPQSTLLLLVSAFVGGDWRTIYDHAMDNGYRFLSYGDSSLLFRREEIEFDKIRPFSDEEAVAALGRLAANPYCLPISKYFFPHKPATFLSRLLKQVRSVDDFQNKVMNGVMTSIIAKTSEGFTISGAENLKALNGKKFLAVTNHRDIVVDPSLLQYALHELHLPYSRICVGSNLLSNKSVADIMRSNRMIIVIRGIGARELYLSSRRLSKYIRQSITTGECSVWIAQKEGRAKHGIDATEQGLLKMFDMSGEKSFKENFEELNIVPMSLSYEYESCDAKKARELYLLERDGKYSKKRNEDLHSILTGIRQFKGHVHLTIGKPLQQEELDLASSASGNERYQALMRIMDERIISGYKLWKTNYMAYDLMNGTSEFLGVKYLPQDVEDFKKYTEHKLSKIKKGLDVDRLRRIFFEIYGNPVVSLKKLQEK